MIMIQQKHRDK